VCAGVWSTGTVVVHQLGLHVHRVLHNDERVPSVPDKQVHRVSHNHTHIGSLSQACLHWARWQAAGAQFRGQPRTPGRRFQVCAGWQNMLQDELVSWVMCRCLCMWLLEQGHRDRACRTI
jgi:hypothetical protein